MDIIVIDRCQSTEPWSSVAVPSQSEEGKVYTILIAWPDDDPSDYICECLGYINRGHCKHQDIAATLLCQWDEREGPEKQDEDQKQDFVCPRCGETTIRSMEMV